MMRATVLAACVAVLLVRPAGSPTFIDRWFWFPFILALCFRDPEEAESTVGARGAQRRRHQWAYRAASSGRAWRECQGPVGDDGATTDGAAMRAPVSERS